MSKGIVYLVGAGPGDPGLLTLKGQQCLQRAEVVIYDRLVNAQLLRHVPASAEKIYAGKGPDDHALEQDEINDLLVKHGKAGRIVVRLKGGDPFVFGRGGEEASALAEAGIPFEIVPGITSAIGAPAYAGIPVTDRRHASSFAVVTGREGQARARSGETRKPWKGLAGNVDTIISLMGIGALAEIIRDVIDEGLSPTTPAALVQWGTTSRQRSVTGTLETIIDNATEAGIGSPSAFIIGDTINLAPELSWFEQQPLFGLRVGVTRAVEGAGALATQLAGLGADPIDIAAIGYADPEDWTPLDAALQSLTGFEWAIFTSAQTVRAVTSRLRFLERDSRAWGGVRIAAVGPATAEALHAIGLVPDLLPASSGNDALLGAIDTVDFKDAKVFIPRSSLADDTVPTGLTRLGAQVTAVTAYQTVAPSDLGTLLREALSNGLDLLSFTSTSTVTNSVAALGEDAHLIRTIPSAVIGPTTAQAANQAGLNVVLEATDHTIPGLARAILDWHSARK